MKESSLLSHDFIRQLAFVCILVFGSRVTGWAIVNGLEAVETLHPSQVEHADQIEIVTRIQRGQSEGAFKKAFELGDALFATSFSYADGVGAYVGDGQRFSRIPRADLAGFGEWAAHAPSRTTGPNAQACVECHGTPAEDGSGSAAVNVVRDPLHTGRIDSFIHRNTPHLFGMGAVQRLAEEMTEALHAIRAAAVRLSRAQGREVTLKLAAKGVDFGFITARRDGSIDSSRVKGVDGDLIVRPFQWKGIEPTIRSFNRDASHNELGMQAVELVGDGVDGDGDGVVNELTIGDITALAIYNAAQPRPTTRTELAALKLIPPLPPTEIEAIHRGEIAFQKAGCDVCHLPKLTLHDPIFREPSRNANFRDAVFPGGQDPASRGVDPNFPITFDLTRDQPQNQIRDAAGRLVFRLGAFERDAGARAVVRLFGDLKRHEMGSGLAEKIDEAETGASVFLTENLWGVGSTAPYLHDGRATTLTEAILEHGGEAQASREAFAALSPPEQQGLIAFLNNLVLFKLEE